LFKGPKTIFVTESKEVVDGKKAPKRTYVTEGLSPYARSIENEGIKEEESD